MKTSLFIAFLLFVFGCSTHQPGSLTGTWISGGSPFHGTRMQLDQNGRDIQGSIRYVSCTRSGLATNHFPVAGSVSSNRIFLTLENPDKSKSSFTYLWQGDTMVTFKKDNTDEGLWSRSSYIRKHEGDVFDDLYR
jgi:hypothetical protein